MSIEKARIAARKALERMYQGRATVYPTHQEIMLTLFEGWA